MRNLLVAAAMMAFSIGCFNLDAPAGEMSTASVESRYNSHQITESNDGSETATATEVDLAEQTSDLAVSSPTDSDVRINNSDVAVGSNEVEDGPVDEPSYDVLVDGQPFQVWFDALNDVDRQMVSSFLADNDITSLSGNWDGAFARDLANLVQSLCGACQVEVTINWGVRGN